MHSKGCARCGSDQHNVSECSWSIMLIFSVAGAAIASCLMNMLRPA